MLCRARSEADIEALQPRAGSPAWLVEEVEAVRAGLMDLRHNVCLLRCPDSEHEFYPVRALPLPPGDVCYCHNKAMFRHYFSVVSPDLQMGFSGVPCC